MTKNNRMKQINYKSNASRIRLLLTLILVYKNLNVIQLHLILVKRIENLKLNTKST